MKDNNQSDKKIDFYKRLKDELEKNADWPLKYMYKFIVPNKDENEELVRNAFKKNKIELRKNYSKTGKYISVTVITTENTADEIIEKYRSLENIEGLIAL